MIRRVDPITVVGLGMLLMPLLTMWHEIGGHAAFCAVQGGHVQTIGAFYVDCDGLAGAPRVLMSCAGVLVNALLSVIAFIAWRRSRSDRARLVLWLVWVSEAFVAAGYLCFSGVTGFGDLATGTAGQGLGAVPMPIVWRVGEFLLGAAVYALVIIRAIKALATMIGNGPDTRPVRQLIAHGYYATVGAAAVLVGLLNPVGVVVTIMSAAASSFGGLAGMISIGFATRPEPGPKDFVVGRSWLVFALGAATLLTFALVLGPSRNF
ncbi:MAG: hypothetical protein ABIW33_05420 [Sphingomicrobium sp.]